MKNIKKFVSLILVLVSLTVLAIPFAPISASAASTDVTVTESISNIYVDTSKDYYVVKNTATMRSSTGLFYSVYANLAKNTVIKINGSNGDFHKVKVTENNKTLTYYIKKSELKKASSNTKATFAYAVKDAPLRKAPRDDGSKIATIKKGTVLYVLGNITNQHKSKWLVVMDQDMRLGYIFNNNVKTTSKITVSVSGPAFVSTASPANFTCKVSPSEITGIKWSVSDTKLADIDRSGKLTAKAGGNVTVIASLGKLTSVELKTNAYLGVKAVFQSNNVCCSAASTVAVLHYKGKATTKKDTDLFPKIQGYVYKIRDQLNENLGENFYCYNTFKSYEAYEKAIRTSLAQNCPVIARIGKFEKQYFNYGSNGHYTVIVGIYEQDGEVWLKVVDSFVNRYKSNTYCDAKSGVIEIPAKTLYEYGKYDGKSPVYLIYNN